MARSYSQIKGTLFRLWTVIGREAIVETADQLGAAISHLKGGEHLQRAEQWRGGEALELHYMVKVEAT